MCGWKMEPSLLQRDAFVILCVCLALSGVMAAPSKPTMPNILYLMADDMRPGLKSYGHDFMITPNLDALAARGLQFQFAYTNYPYCAPSRNSFLSGRRPDRTRVWNFEVTFRETVGANWTTMPEHFLNNGYVTTAAGKIYHDGEDDPKSWSKTLPSNQTRWIECGEGDDTDPRGNYCGVTQKSRNQETDEDLVWDAGLYRLKAVMEGDKPWFVGIGNHRPHWPSRVPDGFYGPQVYPGEIAPPARPFQAYAIPWMSHNNYGGDYHDEAHGCLTCIVPNERVQEYRRWYYAATTYSDFMLGKALQYLNESGHVNNTIVVFHADHGYQVGELNEYSKKTTTELSLHVPLLIAVPWLPQSHGKVSTVKASLIDIYKTLVDLTGVGTVEEGVQGTSLAPVLRNPENPGNLSELVAYSQMARCGCGPKDSYGGQWECNSGACAHVNTTEFNFMGYSMRTSKYRFTAWAKWDNVTMGPDWGSVQGLELYDLSNCTGGNFDCPGFDTNLAPNPSYNATITTFLTQLEAVQKTWK